MKLFILIFLVHAFASACLLDKINIIGLEKTNEQVVLKKINTEIGAEINSNSVELIRQNLKNMQIFSKVEINFDESICRLQVDLVEKWTTIPIFKIGSGGGTKYYVLGVYDVNFLGTYQELGAQYENFQGNNSFVLWYRNPQFIYNNLKLGFDVWNTMREKLIYSAEGVRQGGYSLERKKLNSFIDYEINSSIKIGAAIETNQDVTSDKDISDEVKNENTLNANSILKTETDYRLLSMNIKLGRLNYDNYLIEGAQLTLSHQLITNTKSSNAYSRNILELLAYKKILDTDNISLRLIAAQQNNNDLSQLLEIGGLTEVRGYFDGQFRDNKFNLLNLEYRKTVLEYNKYLLVQAVGFYDRAQVGASLKDLESMGLGLRFISPQIYRFNLRFDFALKTMSKEKQVLSFGLQQFF